MSLRTFIVSVLAIGALCVYLFVSAPPPLEEAGDTAQATVPVKEMFDLLAAENDAARTIYTARIVGPGLAAGMKFNEFWKDEKVEAGPLPALFLREVSGRLARGRTDVGLFLGSDFPIAPVNLFTGDQMNLYTKVKETKQPQFGEDAATRMYIAMYPDYAGAQPCVTCHNEHPDSPKLDWVLNDMMGATTWLFPRPTVSVEKAIETVAFFRSAARASYEDFLAKTQGYTANRPTIGEKWPADGMFLPSADTFMKAVAERASAGTLSRILSLPEKAAHGKS
jgi:hypothetical protein